MNLNIIIFKNKKVDCFTQPQFTDIEPEKAAIQLARSLKINEDIKIDGQYQNLVMYVVGVFDDLTGVITTIKPKKLLDCGKVIASRNAEEGKDNVESVPIDR